MSNTPKSYSTVHKLNSFDESITQTELTKAYSVAEQKLKEKTYAERRFKTKENIIQIRNFYPYLSVSLSLSVGLLVGDLFASGLSQEAYFLTLSLLTVAVFMVAWLLENLKRDACQDYFLSLKPTGGQRLWLNSLFMYSVIISGVGSYVASIHLNDKSAEIEKNYQIQSDSVSTDYAEQIAVLDAVIFENQKRIRSLNEWVRFHAQNDLADAQRQKTDLLKLQNSTLSEIKTEKKAELTAGDLLNQYKAYVIVIVVIILEFLYIRSFAYEYAVERKIKIENRNHGFVKPSAESLPTSEPLTLQDVAMQMLLSNLTSRDKLTFSPANNQIKTGQKEVMGFKIKGDIPAKSVPEKKGKICAHCGKEFFNYERSTRKYCSNNCKTEAFRKRQGKKQ